jgi:hypothetical protein
MFVDDNICIAMRRLIAEAVACAIGSAYNCFGDPKDNARRGSVLAAEKFEPHASHRVVFVGYVIDTRTMRVYWPEDKRTRALNKNGWGSGLVTARLKSHNCWAYCVTASPSVWQETFCPFACNC